jgi:stearoyl-CoA desaturase (delta-9 desaturase)
MKNKLINIFLTASSRKVFLIQTLMLVLALGGIPFFNWGWAEVMTIIFAHLLYGGIGISMTYHRYYSHKSFEFKYEWLKTICTFLGIVSGRGSPIGWVYVHREHHVYADTEKDPHDPGTKGWRIFFHNIIDYGNKVNKKWIKDLFNRTHININKYYMLYIYMYTAILLLCSPWLLYFFYIVPVTVTAWTLNSFVYFSHTHGVTNHETRDNSKNNWVIAILLFGEGWHNNHHHKANNWNLHEKWYQLDPLSWIIRLLKKA